MSDQSEPVPVDEHKRAVRRSAREAMLAKRPKERRFTVSLGEEKIELHYRAIGAKAYDTLVTKYPPTTEQRANGSPYNIDHFGPALLSQVCIEPSLTQDEWHELWASEQWSAGELGELFTAAVDVCGRGLDLTPIEAG